MDIPDQPESVTRCIALQCAVEFHGMAGTDLTDASQVTATADYFMEYIEGNADSVRFECGPGLTATITGK